MKKIMFYVRVAWLLLLIIVGLLAYLGPDMIREQANEMDGLKKRGYSFPSSAW
tara:strand:+ start:749 stop:907 length:159 start_codon:yes stop_codon:yes gene_type:complete